MVQTLKEILQAKETLIFLSQNLDFVINFKKSQLTPVKEIGVFGVSDKFSTHDVSLTSGKCFGYPKQMHVTYSVTKYHNYGMLRHFFQGEFGAGTCNSNRFRQWEKQILIKLK